MMNEAETRWHISRLYLRGKGIEIGALHNPLRVEEGVEVKYVDRLDVASLRRHYPELEKANLVPVDVIDDGEALSSIQDSSLDFIIGNHMLEHCENPLGTIRNHLRKVKTNGILYYAIPDKRFTFDSRRDLTTFKHFVKDDQKGPQASRKEHFLDWAINVYRMRGHEAKIRADQLKEMGYSIHFHVWDNCSWLDFLLRSNKYLDSAFYIECFQINGIELIALLRKKGNVDEDIVIDNYIMDQSSQVGNLEKVVVCGEHLFVGGWAKDPDCMKPADNIILTDEERKVIGVVHPSVERLDVVSELKQNSLLCSGWEDYIDISSLHKKKSIVVSAFIYKPDKKEALKLPGEKKIDLHHRP